MLKTLKHIFWNALYLGWAFPLMFALAFSRKEARVSHCMSLPKDHPEHCLESFPYEFAINGQLSFARNWLLFSIFALPALKYGFEFLIKRHEEKHLKQVK